MREALILSPRADNDGIDMTHVRDGAVSQLVDAFGGATVGPAWGHWRDDETGRIVSEPMWSLMVACDESDPHTTRALRNVANFIRLQARQSAVYLRTPDGAVEFVTTPDTSALAA